LDWGAWLQPVTATSSVNDNAARILIDKDMVPLPLSYLS
jgi:hypothetical protein